MWGLTLSHCSLDIVLTAADFLVLTVNANY